MGPADLFLLLPPGSKVRPSNDKDGIWPYFPQSVKQIPYLLLSEVHRCIWKLKLKGDIFLSSTCLIFLP